MDLISFNRDDEAVILHIHIWDILLMMNSIVGIIVI